ncbi:MAG: hypothetical protein ACYC96_07040 [Fimbriimonadaceae bacterium]
MMPLLAMLLLARPTVVMVHLPAGCIQPQAAVAADGVVHVVYFRGPAAGGDLYYSRIAAGSPALTPPVRVNSVPASAGATGTVRAAQVAVGRSGRVYVVWNGLGPKGPGGYPQAYQAFSRSNRSASSFELQRNLLPPAMGLDGGGAVAADTRGNVFVLWHSQAGAKEEKDGGVYVEHSGDDGATFAPAARVDSGGNGACGCCGMRALVAPDGTLDVLYRGARNNSGRDTIELTSTDGGRTFATHVVDPWPLNACPMSTFGLASGTGGTIAAWETADRVYAANIAPNGAVTGKWSPPGQSQKHPSVAVGANGATLLAWAEGTGWQRGGSLAWRVVSPEGHVLATNRIDGAIDVWSLATAVSRPDGSFLIIY